MAAVGQWGSRTAAEAIAAACGAIAIGIAIGLAIAGRYGLAQHAPNSPRKTKSADERPASESGGRASAETDPKASPLNHSQAVDLRGARLTNARLVRADLRQADLRGATLTAADLTDADLTDARLGPLDEELRDHERA